MFKSNLDLENLVLSRKGKKTRHMRLGGKTSCHHVCNKLVTDFFNNLSTVLAQQACAMLLTRLLLHGPPCYKIVNKLRQVCWNKLSQAVRTQLVGYLLEQHCCKSLSPLQVCYKLCVFTCLR